MKNEPPHFILHEALKSGHAKPLEKEIQKLRVVKSKRELEVMKIAGDISSEAHTKVRQFRQAALHAAERDLKSYADVDPVWTL